MRNADSGRRLRVGVTRECLASVTPQARELHRTILRCFAGTGRAPALPEDEVLRELHDRDVVRLDSGEICAAYPFSAVPTAHIVAIEGGPTVFAMCAVDALGIAEMLGRDIRIESADPWSGEPIVVVIRNGQTIWNPTDAVVFVGSDDKPCGSDAAADLCCGVVNFFAGAESATTWMRANVNVTGEVLTGAQALRLGNELFGKLLA